MSPVIEAAVIAASATGVVAVVAFLTNAWTTSRTLRAARDQRLWDKRSEVYTEILAYGGHRKDFRDHRLRRIRYAAEGEAAVKQFLDSYHPPSWFPFQGQVLTFGSERVANAFIAAHLADDRVWLAWQDRAEAVAVNAADPPSADPQAVAALADKIQAAREEADKADQLLIDAVRRELQPHTRHWRRVWGRSWPDLAKHPLCASHALLRRPAAPRRVSCVGPAPRPAEALSAVS